MACILGLLAGCASGEHDLSRPAPEGLPLGSPLRIATLSDGDAWLRHHMMKDEPDRALRLLTNGRGEAGDPLLRWLQEALVLRQAGEFAASNERLERADLEVERRVTRSLSRTAGSMILNDRVLAYAPGRGEAAMIPFYRMMNYLVLGDQEGALVEARRVGALLAHDGRGDSRRCRQDGAIQYLAGLAFDAAGEMNDALVSLRRAEASFASCLPGSGAALPGVVGADLIRVARSLGVDDVADSAESRYPAPSLGEAADAGDLVLVLERGFVGHRTAEMLQVPIFPDDLEGVEGGDPSGVASAAARVAARLAADFTERGYWGVAWDDQRGDHLGYTLDGAYILRLAWPTFREHRPARNNLRLWIDGVPTDVASVAHLSTVVRSDLEEARASILARMVARGVAKYLLARELERTAEKRGGELLGFVTGRMANVAAVEMERADTRSWSLLPDELAIARLRLPEGSYAVAIETLAPTGESLEWRDLGEVRVKAGKLSVLNQRVWGGEPRD